MKNKKLLNKLALVFDLIFLLSSGYSYLQYSSTVTYYILLGFTFFKCILYYFAISGWDRALVGWDEALYERSSGK